MEKKSAVMLAVLSALFGMSLPLLAGPSQATAGPPAGSLAAPAAMQSAPVGSLPAVSLPTGTLQQATSTLARSPVSQVDIALPKGVTLYSPPAQQKMALEAYAQQQQWPATALDTLCFGVQSGTPAPLDEEAGFTVYSNQVGAGSTIMVAGLQEGGHCVQIPVDEVFEGGFRFRPPFSGTFMLFSSTSPPATTILSPPTGVA